MIKKRMRRIRFKTLSQGNLYLGIPCLACFTLDRGYAGRQGSEAGGSPEILLQSRGCPLCLYGFINSAISQHILHFFIDNTYKM